MMKKIKNWIKKSKWYVIAIVAFLALLAASYFVGRHYADKANKIHLDNITALRDSVKHYQVKIGKLEYQVFEQGQVILTQKEAIKTGLVEKEALRKLNFKYLSELTTANGTISILRDSIGHNGVVYIDTTTHKPVIGLPFTFGDTTKHYTFSGGFNIKGKMNFALKVPISLQVYTGVDKKGKAKASIVTDNPYVIIDKITSLKVDYPKPSRIGFGATVGYGAFYANKQILFGPGVIIGLQFKL